MKSKVSVIIPTYGGEMSLKRAIESVMIQNYENYEIIVVDDNNPETASRELTEKIMNNYKDNGFIKYIKHSKNKNGSTARNTGVANSDGRYICFLDDDDIFLQGKIKKQVEYMDKHLEFGACYCWRKQYGKNVCGIETGDLSSSMLDLSFTPTTCSLMIRKECYFSLNGFDETYIRHQDYEFLLRFYKMYKIGVVKEVLVEIIGNEVNNQPKGQKLYDLKKYFFNQFRENIEKIDKEKHGFKKKVYAEHFSRAFKDLLRYGNWGLAFKLYFTYGIIGGLDFWRIFIKLCFDGMNERIMRIYKYV